MCVCICVFTCLCEFLGIFCLNKNNFTTSNLVPFLFSFYFLLWFLKYFLCWSQTYLAWFQRNLCKKIHKLFLAFGLRHKKYTCHGLWKQKCVIIKRILWTNKLYLTKVLYKKKILSSPYRNEVKVDSYMSCTSNKIW